MTADPTPTTTQASGDRLSPLLSLTKEERERTMGSPWVWRALADDPTLDAATRAVFLRNAEQAAGRAGAS